MTFVTFLGKNFLDNIVMSFFFKISTTIATMLPLRSYDVRNLQMIYRNLEPDVYFFCIINYSNKILWIVIIITIIRLTQIWIIIILFALDDYDVKISGKTLISSQNYWPMKTSVTKYFWRMFCSEDLENHLYIQYWKVKVDKQFRKKEKWTKNKLTMLYLEDYLESKYQCLMYL